jgi:hypothetical protein
MKALLAVAGCCLMLSGRAAAGVSGAGCVEGIAFGTTPAVATADHSAAAPGNQQKFNAGIAPTVTGTGCALPAWQETAMPTWTNPDPLDISISSAPDETNGTAICTGSTSGPVTLTATEVYSQKTYSSSVALSCK